MFTDVEAPRSKQIDAVPRPEGVGLVRRLLDQQLTIWDLARLKEDAELIATELVTNAILHAQSPSITVRLSATDQMLQITVDNIAKGAVTMRAADADDEDGRGLQIVDALSASWGIINCGAHISVFANLRI